MGWCSGSSSSIRALVRYTPVSKKKKKQEKTTEIIIIVISWEGKKNSIYTTKKKKEKHSPLWDTRVSDRDERPKERKKKKAGGNSCGEVRDWQRLKGRKKEEWKRLDALGAVFSPLHLSPNLPS